MEFCFLQGTDTRVYKLQVLHSESSMAQILEDSSQLMNFSFLNLIRDVSNPSLHTSDSGTILTGRLSLILMEEKFHGSSPES